MVGRLLSLPVRVGARATQMAMRTAGSVTERAVVTALQALNGVTRRRSASSEQTQTSSEQTQTSSQQTQTSSQQTQTSSQQTQTQTRERDTARRPQRAETTASRSSGNAEPSTRPDTAVARSSEAAPVVSAPQPEIVEPATAPEPVHVSEESELVREEAEPGAEDGAGASVHIRPPWDGYERMNAREVVSRLRDATAAELATVQLYESSNRSRQTVLDAVERRLKAANGKS